MARQSRIKFQDPRAGYYHIITRTVLGSFLLNDQEKEFFLRLLKKLSKVYFVKVVTFAIMSNHVHLIIRMLPSEDISDEDLKRRFDLYYNVGRSKQQQRELYSGQEAYYRDRFGDLSKFVQDVKQRFSRWFNKKHNNRGHVWGDRFKSVLLESGRALLACMVYVELNSVRAGIVACPEEYRWSGLSHYVAGGRASAWLDHETLAEKLWWYVAHYKISRTSDILSKEETLHRVKDQVKRYLECIYREGITEKAGAAAIDEKVAQRAVDSDFGSLGVLSFDRRIRHFSDGVFLGSKSFCEEQFRTFRDYFATNNERKGKALLSRKAPGKGGLLDIYAIRTLK